jgi:hypothetical protein
LSIGNITNGSHPRLTRASPACSLPARTADENAVLAQATRQVDGGRSAMHGLPEQKKPSFNFEILLKTDPYLITMDCGGSAGVMWNESNVRLLNTFCFHFDTYWNRRDVLSREQVLRR